LNADRDYALVREEQLMIERPKNFAEGFGYGCQATVSSFKSAVAGIVKRPYIETKRNGA